MQSSGVMNTLFFPLMVWINNLAHQLECFLNPYGFGYEKLPVLFFVFFNVKILIKQPYRNKN